MRSASRSSSSPTGANCAKAFSESYEVRFALAFDEDMTAEKAVLDAIERHRRLAGIGAWARALFCIAPVRLDLQFTHCFFGIFLGQKYLLPALSRARPTGGWGSKKGPPNAAAHVPSHVGTALWLSQTHVEVPDVASRWHPGKRIPAPH